MYEFARRLTVGVLVLGVVSACGGSPAPSGTAQSSRQTGAGQNSAGQTGTTAANANGGQVTSDRLPDACGLLSVAEAGALLGKAVKEPAPALDVIGADETGCDWQKADEDNFRLALVQFSVYRSEKYLPRDAYKPAEIIGDVTVAGASGGAFLTRSGKTTVGVNYTVKGRRVTIDVTVDDGDPTARIDAIKTAAALVATRL